MTALRVALITLAMWTAASPGYSQSYPTKTITIVVPAAPGGVTDALGRVLAKHFSDAWGQQAIVENRPGANNQVAAEYVAKAAPDGYTLFVGPETTFIVNPSLTGLVSINHALILSPSLAAKDVKELIGLAKEKPGALNYGTFGVGSSGHLNMELLQAMAGVKLQAVHYKGATPALTDVIAGHIQLMFISVGSAVPQWKSDKVKLVAVGASKRLPLLPEVPTIAESGVPGFEAVSWFGLFGPAGMSSDVVTKINGEVVKLFSSSDFRKNFLERQYFESIAGAPAQLSGYIRSEEPKWRKIIHDAKIKPID